VIEPRDDEDPYTRRVNESVQQDDRDTAKLLGTTLDRLSDWLVATQDVQLDDLCGTARTVRSMCRQMESGEVTRSTVPPMVLMAAVGVLDHLAFDHGLQEKIDEIVSSPGVIADRERLERAATDHNRLNPKGYG
jgi:hypothetical protein